MITAHHGIALYREMVYRSVLLYCCCSILHATLLYWWRCTLYMHIPGEMLAAGLKIRNLKGSHFKAILKWQHRAPRQLHVKEQKNKRLFSKAPIETVGGTNTTIAFGALGYCEVWLALCIWIVKIWWILLCTLMVIVYRKFLNKHFESAGELQKPSCNNYC